MFVRVATYTGDVDELLRGFEAVLPELRRMDGFSNAYICVNRDSGESLTMTVWESAETLEGSSEHADQLRSWMTSQAGATTDSVMQYEVALMAHKALVATAG